VRVEALWPRDQPKRYGSDWGYAINGNSVTFRLTYCDFSMLFTGDHNEDSEGDLLTLFKAEGTLDRLRSDVLKVPHHGSRHGIKAFFDAVSPVVSVASMGSKGFAVWGHPSTDVIGWLGGAHRVYHTHLHERKFDYGSLTALARAEMIENKHVVIETDGRWFRVVEVDDARVDPPPVQKVRRGDGTRWISARE
jgi:hypothetical protein